MKFLLFLFLLCVPAVLEAKNIEIYFSPSARCENKIIK